MKLFAASLIAMLTLTAHAERVYQNALKKIEDPKPLLADHPEFIEPVREVTRFLADHRPKGAGEEYGSGHTQATGGALRIPDWNGFITDLGCMFACVGLYLAVVFRRMLNHPVIPVRDPRLQRAIDFVNA